MQQVQQVGDLITTLKADKLDRTTTALTIVATLLLVPTLLAGAWGMNFRRIPGAGVRGGFGIALLVLAVVASMVGLGIWLYLRDPSTTSRRPKL
jgi:magnesium transporter